VSEECPVRSPELTVLTTYRRTIEASIERVWENVLDWEHLPWLHSSSFAGIECTGAGPWGWRADLQYPGVTERAKLELLIDHDEGQYVSRVVSGPGAPSEIWTRLRSAGERSTDIVVEFCSRVPEGVEPEQMGQGYRGLYKQLWDEDEQMMQVRQAELDRRGSPLTTGDPVECVELGSIEHVSASLPLDVDAFGARMRIADVDGTWLLYPLACPHWLGPLDASPIEGGQVECPWHGYRFDLNTGASCDGQHLRLTLPASLVIDRDTDRVCLVPENASSNASRD
jgi:nitrite reductase/ring-hydroxylating ferredoxin subunit